MISQTRDCTTGVSACALRVRTSLSAAMPAAALLALCGALCEDAFAQSPLATDIKRSEIQAVVDAPNLGTDRQIKVVDIGTHNVAVGVLRRGKTTPGAPVPAINHAEVTEVYYVVSGSGTLLTGGTVEKSEAVPADSEIVKVAVGPSNRAIFKEPAQKRKVDAGDMVIIPAGVYHGFTDVADHIEYVSVRSDPKHVLPAGYVSPPLQGKGASK
jgi:mannose-6-phosphate isomerase-like protein (cupin superfamily)